MVEYLKGMESLHFSNFLLAANYPPGWVMGLATLAMLAFIFGGGIWMKKAEEKARAAERAYQQRDS